MSPRTKKWLKIIGGGGILLLFIGGVAFLTLLVWVEKNWLGKNNGDGNAVVAAIILTHGGDNYFPEKAIFKGNLPDGLEQRCVAEGRTLRTCIMPPRTGKSPVRDLMNEHCFMLQNCAVITFGNSAVYNSDAMRKSIEAVAKNPCVYLPNSKQASEKKEYFSSFLDVDYEQYNKTHPFGKHRGTFSEKYYAQMRMALHCDTGKYRGKIILGFFSDNYKTQLEVQTFRLRIGD